LVFVAAVVNLVPGILKKPEGRCVKKLKNKKISEKKLKNKNVINNLETIPRFTILGAFSKNYSNSSYSKRHHND